MSLKICPKCLAVYGSIYDRFCRSDGKRLVDDYEADYPKLAFKVKRKVMMKGIGGGKK